MIRELVLTCIGAATVCLSIVLADSPIEQGLHGLEPAVRPSVEEEILAADDRFWQAAGDHDVPTLGLLLSDQYSGWTPDGAHWDKASILAQHERVRTANMTRVKARRVHVLREDAAVLTYATSYSMLARDGAPLDAAEQEMTSYWIRRDGRWQVMFAHVTPPNRPRT